MRENSGFVVALVFLSGTVALADGPSSLDDLDPLSRAKAAAWVGYIGYKTNEPNSLGAVVAIDAVNAQLKKNPNLDVKTLFDRADQVRSAFNDVEKKAASLDGTRSLDPRLMDIYKKLGDSAEKILGPGSELITMMVNFADASLTATDYLKGPADHRDAALWMAPMKNQIMLYKQKVLEEAAARGLNRADVGKLYDALLLQAAPLAAPLGSLPSDFGARDEGYGRSVGADHLRAFDEAHRLSPEAREKELNQIASQIGGYLGREMDELIGLQQEVDLVRVKAEEADLLALNLKIEQQIASSTLESSRALSYLAGRLFGGPTAQGQRHVAEMIGNIFQLGEAMGRYRASLADATALYRKATVYDQQAADLLKTGGPGAIEKATKATNIAGGTRRMASTLESAASMNFFVMFFTTIATMIMPSGEDPNFAFLRALDELDKTLLNHHWYMQTRLDALDAHLAASATIILRRLDEVLDNQRAEKQRWNLTQAELNGLNERMRSANAQLRGRTSEVVLGDYQDLDTTIESVLNGTLRAPLSAQDRRNFSIRLLRCSELTASGENLADRGPILPVDHLRDSYFDELHFDLTGTLWQHIDPLARLASKEYNNKAFEDGTDRYTNLFAWVWCAKKNIRLALLDWDAYAREFSPDRWRSDIRVGETLARQTSKLPFIPDEQGGATPNFPFFNTLIDDYARLSTAVVDKLEAERADIERENLGGLSTGATQNNHPSDRDVFLGADGKAHSPFALDKIESMGGDYPALQIANPATPSRSLNFIPEYAFLAHQLGLATLKIRYQVFFWHTENREVDFGHDFYGMMRMRVSADLVDNKQFGQCEIAHVFIDSEHIPYGKLRKYKENARDGQEPHYRIVRECLVDFDKKGGIVLPAGQNIVWQHINQHQSTFADKVRNATVTLDVTETQVKEYYERLIASYLRGPARRYVSEKVRGRLESSSEVVKALKRVDAAKSILSSYLTLGLPRTTQSDLGIRSALFGSGFGPGALPDAAYLRAILSRTYQSPPDHPGLKFLEALLPRLRAKKRIDYGANSPEDQMWKTYFQEAAFPWSANTELPSSVFVELLPDSKFLIDPRLINQGLRIELENGGGDFYAADLEYNGKAYELRMFRGQTPEGPRTLMVIEGTLKTLTDNSPLPPMFETKEEAKAKALPLAYVQPLVQVLPEHPGALDYHQKARNLLKGNIDQFRQRLAVKLAGLKGGESVPLLEETLDQLRAMELLHQKTLGQ